MKTLALLVSSLAAILFVSDAAAAALNQAAPADPAPAPIVAGATATRVDDYLSRLSRFGYSGATLIAKNGRVILRKGYGMANDRMEHRVRTIASPDIA